MVGIDIRPLNADQTLDILPCWAQSLSEEIGHHFNQLGMELWEASKIL